MKGIVRLSIIFICFLLNGCTTLDEFTKEIVDTVSFKDEVTGERSLGLMNEEEEIRIGEESKNYYIEECQRRGEAIDEDVKVLAKLNEMLNRITEVSHRPSLPWEIHLVNTKESNAFALPGGKIFVLKGILGDLVTNDEELAGVIAHEVAHITCRHQVKSQAWSLIMPMIQKRARKEIYQASYSTIQEDEADRIGLLYMALAGYNPEVVYNTWRRTHEKYGSRPGNYRYDHSLNIDRANKVAQLIPIAKKYFVGKGIKNPNYAEILISNDLIPRYNIQTDSGLLAILDLGLNTYSQYLSAKTEQISRETTKSQKEYYLSLTKLDNIRQEQTMDGYIGIFGNLTNLSNMTMKEVEITIYYLDFSNRILYSERQTYNNIYPGQTIVSGFYLKDIPNCNNIEMQVTNVEF